MNRLHVGVRIQELALHGQTEVGQIFKLIRDELSAVSQSIESLGLKRTDLEAQAKQSLETVSNVYFPCERRKLELEVAEGKIRADVLDLLATVDLADPNVAREVFESHRAVGSSSGPASIRAAFDALEGAEVDCAAVKAALAVIYPPEPEE